MVDENVHFETTEIKAPRMNKGRFGMNWKSILTAVVILAIGAMLLITEGGREFASNAMDFIGSGVGNTISGFFSQAFNWGTSEWDMNSSDAFTINATFPKEIMYGQQFSVKNTSLDAKGYCENAVTVSGLKIRTESGECAMYMDGMEGEFEYTEAGMIKFDGTVTELKLNGNVYDFESGEISFEMVPEAYKLSDLSQKEMIIPSTIGTINRISQTGDVKSTEGLDSETLIIDGFVGFINLEESNINLQGLTVSVEGTGPYSSFSW